MNKVSVFSTIVVSIILLISGNGAKQTIVFSNLDGQKGKLYIAWYNNEADFRKENKAVISKVVPVDGQESVSVAFENVSPTTYAVAVFFDENGNGKMDTNMFGIPKEKYGFSNDAHPATRPANFSEAAFKVDESEHTFTIRLK